MQQQELCNFLCAAVCNIKEMRGPNGENITRNESLFAKALSWKIARKCIYASTMARVKVKRWLGGGGGEKRRNKASTLNNSVSGKDFQILACYCSDPSCDFTAEGTRQLQDELNCSLAPGWVPVSQSFPSVTPPGSAELTIFHPEGESIPWPHHYDTLRAGDGLELNLRAILHVCNTHYNQQVFHTGSAWWALIVPVQSSVVSNDLNSYII